MSMKKGNKCATAKEKKYSSKEKTLFGRRDLIFPIYICRIMYIMHNYYHILRITNKYLIIHTD